jgi:tetratricopeptide (TPR) repeat protein
MTLPRLLLAALVLLATAAPARADRGDDPGLRAAKRHFQRGEKLYALAKFTEALDEYQEAFDAKPIPDFLFNIGQCYRNLGDYAAAVFSYKKYLKLAPDAPNRVKVEALIRELEQKQEQQEAERDTERLRLQARPKPTPAAPDDQAEAPAPRAEHHPIYTRWWFWTGVAVVAGGGGVLAYELTRPGAPPTTLGNIDFGK